jgi:xanthine dehydrogenase YagR molybdenum-binding subunit
VSAVRSAPAVGAPVSRLEGAEKVAGEARYAYEYPRPGLLHGALVQSTIGRGEIDSVDVDPARRIPGVAAIVWYENAPRLSEESPGELRILQSPHVSYRGQIVAVVAAEDEETAAGAAALVRVRYREQETPRTSLSDSDPRLYRPEKVNPNFPTDTEDGDVDEALAAAAASVDRTYRTPAEHNNPMEPHAAMAAWEDGSLTLHDSTQGTTSVRDTIAALFEIAPERVRVISPHVGGGFGSKGTPRPHVVAAALAASVTGRPVKLAMTRRQMFALAGYRTPTIQRVRLGADEDGRLTAIAHDVVEQTSTVQEFAEQTAVVTRMMYSAPSRRTTHRLAALDLPTPSWMRAPGECPGMFALESAVDELAGELGIDPIELRLRNDPDIDPESGLPFSTRNLAACLREGAARFGWQERRGGRDRGEGRFLCGAGVAASTYPARWRPSRASASAEADGTYVVRLAAADIGTGARTALAQVAADELEVPLEAVRLELGDSRLPDAPLAGGSMGTSSWANAIAKAARALRDAPDGTTEVEVDTADDVEAGGGFSAHSFGAQFAEVRIDTDTGEVRVRRLLGVFAAGRIVNAKTAGSQLIGGMTMGLGMALMEESVLDSVHGDYLNRDLAMYHVPVQADIEQIEAHWIEEHDPHVNPLGIKGIGELGIVGTAAAIANAVADATGVRIRELPLRPDRVLAALA